MLNGTELRIFGGVMIGLYAHHRYRLARIKTKQPKDLVDQLYARLSTSYSQLETLDGQYNALQEEFDQQTADFEQMKDAANRSGYLVAYLAVKLVEAEVELTEFDMMVLHNPPKIFDDEVPTRFAEILKEWAESQDESDEPSSEPPDET